MIWEPMSPNELEPASLDRKRQTRGKLDRNPILRIAGAKVKEALAQIAASNHLSGQRDRRHAPIIVANHVDDSRLAHRVRHALRLGEIACERFLAQIALPASAAAIAIAAWESLGVLIR